MFFFRSRTRDPFIFPGWSKVHRNAEEMGASVCEPAAIIILIRAVHTCDDHSKENVRSEGIQVIRNTYPPRPRRIFLINRPIQPILFQHQSKHSPAQLTTTPSELPNLSASRIYSPYSRHSYKPSCPLPRSKEGGSSSPLGIRLYSSSLIRR